MSALSRAQLLASSVSPGSAGLRPAASRRTSTRSPKDLTAHRGASLVLAGRIAAAAVHAIAHGLNEMLGNVGHTVVYVPTPEIVPTEQHAALRQLVVDMDAGRVQMLLVIGESNPGVHRARRLEIRRRD